MIQEGLQLAFEELDLIDGRGEERGMSLDKVMDILSQKTPLSEANLKAHNSLPETDGLMAKMPMLLAGTPVPCRHGRSNAR